MKLGVIALALSAAPVLAQDDGMDGKWYKADVTLVPEEVIQNLPSDVSPSQILMKDRCFYYQVGNKAYPITTPDTGKYPYCIM